MARLEKAYEATFGSEATKAQLYRGFYTLLAGVGLGVLALVLLLVGNGMADENAAASFTWKKVAYTLGALAAPLFFFGISTALPSKKTLFNLSVIGLVLCAGAAAFFGFVAYPEHWNVAETTQTDYTAPVAGVFAVGFLLIIVSSFTGVIGYYLDRVAAATTARGQEGEDMAFGYDVPDALVERDIDYAMRKYRYAWGDTQSQAAGGLQINIHDEFEAGVTVGGKGVARTVQLDTPQVDEATKVLRGIRPSKDKTMAGDWEADTTKALLAFRQQKMEQDAVRIASRRRGFWARLWDWLTGRKPEAAALAMKSDK